MSDEHAGSAAGALAQLIRAWETGKVDGKCTLLNPSLDVYSERFAEWLLARGVQLSEERPEPCRALVVEALSDFHDYIGQTVAGHDWVKRARAAVRAIDSLRPPERDEYAKSPVDKVEYIRCVVEAFEADAKLSGKRRREYADQANAYLDDLIGAIAAASGAKP